MADELAQLRAELAKSRQERDYLLRRRGELEAEIASGAQSLRECGQARDLIQEVAADVQNAAHARVVELASKCLNQVFKETAYTFKVSFEKKRGKTEASLKLERGGHEFTPMGSAGGGVVDVAAFALRVSALVLSRPRVRRLVISDEGFRYLSAEYIPAAKALLEALCEETGFQFIIVTHQPELACGNVVDFS